MRPFHKIPKLVNAHEFPANGGAEGAARRDEARLLNTSTKANRFTFSWSACGWNSRSMDWLWETSAVTMPLQEAIILLMLSLKFTMQNLPETTVGSRGISSCRRALAVNAGVIQTCASPDFYKTFTNVFGKPLV